MSDAAPLEDAADLAQIANRLSALETALAAAELDIERLGRELTALGTRMDVDGATLDGLNEATGDNERDTERAHERITSLEADLGTLETRVDDLEGDRD